MMSGRVMVQFDRVSKRYTRKERGGSLRDTIPALAARVLGRGRRGAPAGQFWALRDVSFEVRDGEALGVIGHNGAGKSTVLKLLAGVTAPTEGHARVNGRFAALIELGAGFHPDLTGRENVYLNGSILGLRKAEIDRKLESIVDFAGIDKFIDTPVKHYSSGMHARLGFAVAAHVEPEVLLIDEVLSVGDFNFQQKCLRKMEEFRRSGVSIVFVSHNLNAIVSMCSRAILMRTGQVVAAGTPLEVIDSYAQANYSVVSDEEAEQITRMEHGRVTHHVEILGVDIRDDEGRPSRSFLAGAKATITINLLAHRHTVEPIVGISIRNGMGIVAYETNSGFLKASTGEMLAGEEVTVSFPLTLHLCQAAYAVTVGVAPSEGAVLLDWRESMLRFDVFDDQTGSGVADLRASIDVTKVRTGDSEAVSSGRKATA